MRGTTPRSRRVRSKKEPCMSSRLSLASLLAVLLGATVASSANAQESADAFSSPATAQTPASAIPPSAASSPLQPEPEPPKAAPQPVAASASTVPASAPSPTMDQVVDRVVEREQALMKMLKTRTPIIETYLQDLKFVPHVG